MLADAQNPIFIGQNLINIRDEDGKYVVREILKVAKESTAGWITFKNKGAYSTVYVELVEVPDGKYVLGAGYWPSSKEVTARSLAEKAVSYFNNHTLVESLHAVTRTNNEFIRGDLWVSVYSEDGICLADGLDLDRIWYDETVNKDEQGYSVMDKIQAVARKGGGWVEYPFEGGQYRNYVKMVSRDLPKEVIEVLKEREQAKASPEVAKAVDEEAKALSAGSSQKVEPKPEGNGASQGTELEDKTEEQVVAAAVSKPAEKKAEMTKKGKKATRRNIIIGDEGEEEESFDIASPAAAKLAESYVISVGYYV